MASIKPEIKEEVKIPIVKKLQKVNAIQFSEHIYDLLVSNNQFLKLQDLKKVPDLSAIKVKD